MFQYFFMIGRHPEPSVHRGDRDRDGDGEPPRPTDLAKDSKALVKPETSLAVSRSERGLPGAGEYGRSGGWFLCCIWAFGVVCETVSW